MHGSRCSLLPRPIALVVACCLLPPLPLLAADPGSRPVITVLDFKGSSVSKEEIEVFVDYLCGQIVETEIFRVIDRTQRELLLQEQQFSVSDCSDEKCQLEVGKLLAANQLVVGSLGKVGTRFLLNMKLIDVETGETVRTASEKYDSLDALIDDSKRLAQEFVARGEPAVAAAEPAAKVEEPEPAAVETTVQPAAVETTAPVAPAQRRGAALEFQGGAVFGDYQNAVELGGAFVYQFGNRFSLGLWGGYYMGPQVPSVGLRLVFGNKVDGLALLLDLGIMPGIGLYFRSFFAAVEFLPGWGLGFRAGYSIFLGRR